MFFLLWVSLAERKTAASLQPGGAGALEALEVGHQRRVGDARARRAGLAAPPRRRRAGESTAGETNEVASMRRSPASTRAAMRRSFPSGGRCAARSGARRGGRPRRRRPAPEASRSGALAGCAGGSTATMSCVELPGVKISETPSSLSRGMSSSGMIPPPNTSMSRRLRSPQQVDDRGEERHVGAGHDGQTDRVDVLLDGGVDDHLRGLVQPRVDDLHAGVAERAGDDLRAAIVSVEAGLGHEDSELLVRHPRSRGEG